MTLISRCVFFLQLSCKMAAKTHFQTLALWNMRFQDSVACRWDAKTSRTALWTLREKTTAGYECSTTGTSSNCYSDREKKATSPWPRSFKMAFNTTKHGCKMQIHLSSWDQAKTRSTSHHRCHQQLTMIAIKWRWNKTSMLFSIFLTLFSHSLLVFTSIHK